MFKKYQLFFYILAIFIIGFLVWFYSTIVIYILLAVVLSIIGQPIVILLTRIKIPRSLAAFITLLVMLAFFISFFLIFVPLFAKEAEMISKLDFKSIGNEFSGIVSALKDQLVKYDILKPHESINGYLNQRIKDLLDIAKFKVLFQHVLHSTGEFLIGIFSVCFITLFFLKDENMFENIVLSLVNTRYHEQTKAVLEKSKRLLRRYFIGLICDILLMMTLISIAMTLFGVHNAMLIGFFAGIVVIIPYVGPMIGITVAVIIGVTSGLSIDIHTPVLPLTIKIAVVYLAINMTDGLIFQPLIYGKSVKASPLEIFLVILISGTTAGIAGMAIAVPVYTLIRIIAKEFFSQFRSVANLTKDL